MNICHVVPGLHPRAGGPSRTVVQLADALVAQTGVFVTLVSQGQVGEPQVPSRNVNISRQVGSWRWQMAGILGLPGRRNLISTLAHTSPELVHIHGIWHALSHWASVRARKRGIPIVLQPRGMLEPWALEWRSLKKKLALWAYQARDLESACVLIATADHEAEGFRRFGLRQPIAVIPNGIERTPELLINKKKGGSGEKNTRRVLFLGRIHPVKGLLNLLVAWAALNPHDWELVLAGPDEGGHLTQVQKKIARLGLQDSVQYLGSVEDHQKDTVYQSADLFILPSLTENFGVVVAEALSYGLPVITTKGTPWSALEENNCGWWVEPSANGLLGALRDATTKEPEKLHSMGKFGIEYAKNYDWSAIAKNMADVYRWMLGSGDQPNNVVLD